MFCCTNKRLPFLVIFGLATVLGLAYLLQWQVILSYAPFLLILLCPLMHLFGGHGEHHASREPPTKGGKKPSCH